MTRYSVKNNHKTGDFMDLCRVSIEELAHDSSRKDDLYLQSQVDLISVKDTADLILRCETYRVYHNRTVLEYNINDVYESMEFDARELVNIYAGRPISAEFKEKIYWQAMDRAFKAHGLYMRYIDLNDLIEISETKI